MTTALHAAFTDERRFSVYGVELPDLRTQSVPGIAQRALIQRLVAGA